MNDNKFKIIEMCRRARRERDLSQVDVARESKFSQGRISQFENGYYNKAIAEYYFDNILFIDDITEILDNGGL